MSQRLPNNSRRPAAVPLEFVSPAAFVVRLVHADGVEDELIDRVESGTP